MDTKALRQKILDLAIRGKLVPQDPNDEPASVLLERIREQKKQMVKEGKLKAKDIKNDSVIFIGEDNLHYEKFADGSVKCIEDEIPFELPDGWAWTRLASILSLSSGKSIKVRQLTDEGEYPVYGGNGINGTYFDYNVETNTIIIGRVGYYCGSVYKTTSKAWVTDNALIATVKELGIFEIDFVVEVLKYLNLGKTSVSTAQPVVSGKGILPLIVPIPPQNEQISILESYNQIIPILNILEKEKEEVLSLVVKAKSKILALAIRGQLVPQNPDDEPASVLLERIRAEKEELIKQGKIKRDKKESVIFKGEDNSYYVRQGAHKETIDEQFIFELPDNWKWCSLLNVAKIELGKTLDSAKNTGTNHPYLRSVNVRWNDVDLSDLKEMRFEPEELERYTVRRNDLLICEGGDVGRSCVWTTEDEILYQNALHRVRFYGECNPFYFMYYMMYYESRGTIKALCKGVTIKHLTGNVLSLIPFALPPIEEQNRIVERLNHIFHLLDSILCE